MLHREPLDQGSYGLGKDGSTAFIPTPRNVLHEFIKASTIRASAFDLLPHFASREAGQHPVCAVKVRDVLCDPYPTHLREGPHDLVHALPVD